MRADFFGPRLLNYNMLAIYSGFYPGGLASEKKTLKPKNGPIYLGLGFRN